MSIVENKKIEYLEGNINAFKDGKYIKIGYIVLHPAIFINGKDPDFFGDINLLNIGHFRVSLWKHETVKIIVKKQELKK
jgi:hypothetical protein